MVNSEFKTVVIFCEKMAIGGTETLIMRLLSWYSAKNFRVVLLTLKEIDSIALSVDINKIDFEHYIYNVGNKIFSTKDGVSLRFDKKEKVWVNTQFLPEFLICYNLLRSNKFNCFFIHTIFIVHPYSSFLFGENFNFLGRTLMKILLRDSNLLFMDEACVAACIDFYNLDKNNFNLQIYRLPFLVSSDESTVAIKSISPLFNILTISRFEFPFKGYVLGLINAFANICHDYDGEVQLTIIGYGRDKFKVDELINSLPVQVSNKITVLDEVPYSKINEYIEKCSLFVGMGTTILDAANLNKMIIVPVAYQNSNLTTGFFHENYNVIGEVFREEGVYETFEVLIIKALNYSQNDFIDISKKSKAVLREHYDINLIAKKIITHTIKIHSWFDCQVVRTISKLQLLSIYVYKKRMYSKK
jgi:hypothetical protein